MLGLYPITLSHCSVKQEVKITFSDFIRRRILGMSAGIEEVGNVRWDLALCLLASWVFCYFSIWKGVKSSGKVDERVFTLNYFLKK